MDREKRSAIITDSACDLPDDVLRRYSIHMVPLRMTYRDVEYRDRVELSSDAVYEMMRESSQDESGWGNLPKSSLPYPQDVMDKLESLKAQGITDVLYITISSGLSGTYNMIRCQLEDVEGIRVRLVDTKTLSMGEGLLIIEAARELEETGDMDAAVARMEAVRSRMASSFIIRTLEYLRRGGRIGKVEGAVGSLLHIKPVITVNDEGVYVTKNKSMGFKKAREAMVEEFRRLYKDKEIVVSVVHGACREEAEKLLARLREFAQVQESYVSAVSPVLSLHTGQGLLGIIAYEV